MKNLKKKRNKDNRQGTSSIVTSHGVNRDEQTEIEDRGPGITILVYTRRSAGALVEAWERWDIFVLPHQNAYHLSHLGSFNFHNLLLILSLIRPKTIHTDITYCNYARFQYQLFTFYGSYLLQNTTT